MHTHDLTPRRFPARQAGLIFAAASLLFNLACGAGVPEKPEASSAISKAIESTLTRTLPMATYCQTVDPRFSFANMGQMDLVEMLQNVSDKSALNDAAAAGVIAVELKEFRVGAAGRSPDASCDALHAQYKQNNTGGPIRFAVVRTTVTPKGVAAGVQLATPIDAATRELVDVTDIRSQGGGFVAVKYTWKWAPTKMGEAIGYASSDPQEATARLKHAGGGWVVDDTGIKR